MKRIILLVALLFPSLTLAQPKIVIYKQNFAIVTEPITLTTSRAETYLVLTNLPATVDPRTLILTHPSKPDTIKILECESLTRPVDETSLLQLYEGKVLDFETINPTTGERRIIRGRLIRAPYTPVEGHPLWDAIVELEGKIRFGLPGKPLFDPTILSTSVKPITMLKIKVPQPGRYQCELCYEATGFGWESIYVINLESETSASLIAQAMIKNDTTKDFYQSQVTLLAGEIHRPRPPTYPARRAIMPMATAAGETVDETYPTPEFEYYKFQFPYLVSICAGQTKLYELFRFPNMKGRIIYIFQPQRYFEQMASKRIFATISLETTNKVEFGLGQPLPSGLVKAYSKSADGTTTLIGECMMPDTPENEQMKLTLGLAFDLTMERKILSETSIVGTEPSSIGPRVEKLVELVINNAKTNAVQVKVFEPLEYPRWRIVNSSHPFTRVDAKTVLFEPTIPVASKTTISYTVRYNDPKDR